MSRRSPSLLLVCAMCALLVGCGGTSGGAGPDPASSLPADATLYLELVVRPEGELKQQMEAFAGRVLRTEEPGRRIVELLESSGDGADYEKDIAPWLGPRVGLAVSGLDSAEPSFLAAAALTDSGKASEAIARLAQRDGATKRSVDGHDAWVDDESAVTVAGDFVLMASGEDELRRALSAQDGESLADAGRFKDALEPLDDDRAGTIFLDTGRLIRTALQGGQLGLTERQILGQVFGDDEAPPAAVAVMVEDRLLAFDSTVDAGKQGGLLGSLSSLGVFGSGAVVGEAPGDAFAVAGIPDLGETAKTLIDRFGGAVGGAVIGAQVEQQTGINLERDIYSWLGDVALFVRGANPAEIDGGLLIEVRDAAAAKAALPKITGALQQQGVARSEPVQMDGADLAFALSDIGTPKPVVVALAGERAVIAFGAEAARAALQPGSKLKDAPLWNRATGTLDDLDPSFLVDAPALLALVSGLAAGDPGFAAAKPYLETIDVLAGGAEKDGDELDSRFAVGLK